MGFGKSSDYLEGAVVERRSDELFDVVGMAYIDDLSQRSCSNTNFRNSGILDNETTGQ